MKILFTRTYAILALAVVLLVVPQQGWADEAPDANVDASPVAATTVDTADDAPSGDIPDATSDDSGVAPASNDPEPAPSAPSTTPTGDAAPAAGGTGESAPTSPAAADEDVVVPPAEVAPTNPAAADENVTAPPVEEPSELAPADNTAEAVIGEPAGGNQSEQDVDVNANEGAETPDWANVSDESRATDATAVAAPASQAAPTAQPKKATAKTSKSATVKKAPSSHPLANGKYLILWVKNANYLVQSLKMSKSSGARVVLAKNTAIIRQRWTVKYLSAFKGYTIVNELTKKALAVSSAKNGANVLQVTPKSGDSAQLWVVTKVNGKYVFSPRGNTKLAITGVSAKSGFNLVVKTTNSGKDQQFDPKKRGFIRDSAYSISLSGKSGQVLEVANYSSDAKAKAQWNAYKGELNQKYKVTYVGKDRYTVQCLQTGKYLGVADGKVVQMTNAKAAAQQWIFTVNGTGLALRNSKTGQRLTAPDKDVSNNALPSTAKPANNETQRFTLTKRRLLDNGVYLIRPYAGKRALNILDGSLNDRGNVNVEKISSGNRQKFRITYVKNGLYRIVNVKSGLAVGSDNAKQGANVRQRTANKGDVQLWKAQISPSGGIKFVLATAGGRTMDVAGTGTASGANVRVVTADNSIEQRWWVQKTAVKSSEVIVDKALAKARNQGSATNYFIAVDIKNHRTIVMKRTNGIWKVVKNWICTTGAPSSPTVLGTYTVGIKGYSFGSGYTCYYYTQFWGDYLFHSVKYYEGTRQVMDGRLGMDLSEGCVRLDIANAKWIYDTIPEDTRVVTYR